MAIKMRIANLMVGHEAKNVFEESQIVKNLELAIQRKDQKRNREIKGGIYCKKKWDK